MGLLNKKLQIVSSRGKLRPHEFQIVAVKKVSCLKEF